jgi:hypothetical protein
MGSDDYEKNLGLGFPHLVGRDPAGEKEKEAFIEELVTLKKIDAIAYERRRNIFGVSCNRRSSWSQPLPFLQRTE